MRFSHLDAAIPEGREEDFFSLFGRLQEPTKSNFELVLDLGAYMNGTPFNDRYAVTGSYAILSHLMKLHSPEIASTWKGFSNPTIVGNGQVLGALRAGYHTKGGPQNRTDMVPVFDMLLKLEGKDERLTFVYNEVRKNPGSVETNEHFGVPLKVNSPESLLEHRLGRPMTSQGNIGDTLTLVHIMEQRGYSPDSVAEYAIANKQADELAKRIKTGYDKFGRDRFGVFPSDKFVATLLKRLHKVRPVA
ncbi:MAG TPA: hypothetical protein VHA12_03685 [Candidatus Nanoarchaeia archaeon]|nr:hypothetical protein [Candidatus Nanoarchaeia archaeon]